MTDAPITQRQPCARPVHAEQITRLFAALPPWEDLESFSAEENHGAYTTASVRALLARTAPQDLAPTPLTVAGASPLFTGSINLVRNYISQGELTAFRHSSKGPWLIPVLSVQSLVQQILRPRGCRVRLGQTGVTGTVLDYEARGSGLHLLVHAPGSSDTVAFPAHLSLALP